MTEKTQPAVPAPSMYALYISDVLDEKTCFSFTSALGPNGNGNRNDRILLTLSSTGGASMETLCVVDALNAWPQPNCVIATGMVGSAATYLLANGGLRLAFSHAHFLFHPASTRLAYSSPQELKSSVQYMTDITKAWNQLYQEKIGLTKKEVNKLCNHENYLNAFTALNLGKRGLIDGIILKLLDGFKYEILMRNGVRKVVDLAVDDYATIRDLSTKTVDVSSGGKKQ